MAMYEYCKRFYFAADMNADLAFTISDVWLLSKQAWLLPAKGVVALLHEHDDWASFFEITCATGEGAGGAIFSLFAWMIVLPLAAALLVSIGKHGEAVFHALEQRAWTPGGAKALAPEVRDRASFALALLLISLLFVVPAILVVVTR
jgi:hypothetical protein